MSDHLVALITGSSRGIGRAIAVELARLGYSTLINYATRPDAAADVVEQITTAGGRAVAARGDVSDADERAGLVHRALDEWGRLDVLVNNAGITSVGRNDLLEATEESWDRVLGTNLKGPFFLSQLAAREMIRLIDKGTIPSGKIINISSVSAYATSQNRADYCIAKRGMEMMTWLFAERLAEQQIGVFEICPGVIESDMTAPVHDKYERMIQEGAWPIRRFGQPEDVAKAVSSVVNDNFPFTTGQRIHVDGGLHIRRL